MDQAPPLDANQSPARRVLIIGGGVGGLATALALKRVSRNTGLNIQPIIFERHGPYIYHEEAEEGNPAQFYILWRWCIDLLREMGLAHRLAKIARPIVTFKSSDADTKESLVQWPPLDIVSTTNSTPATANSTPEPPMGDPNLPPMVGIRRIDLIRLLMLALTEDGDEQLQKESREAQAGKSSMTGSDTVVDFGASQGANNADGVDVPEEDPLKADMARGNWFERENFLQRIPYLCLGYDLASFIISASTGVITARFTNGHVEVCDMMVGADGINSKVRELIGSDRYPPQHAGAFVCHGISRFGGPPPNDAPQELHDGTVIPPITTDDVKTLCPELSSLSIIGRGMSLGIANLGNSMVGWNVLAAQVDEGHHLKEWEEQKRRIAVSRAVARTSRMSPISIATAMAGAKNGLPITETSPLHQEPESDLTISSSPPQASSINGASNVDAVEEDTMAKLEGRSTGDAPRRGTQPTAFEVQLRQQLAERHSQIFETPAAIEAPPISPHPDGMHLIRGSDARGIALKLAATLPVPQIVHAIIARTDPAHTVAMDVMDMADRWLDSYTSATFHPGRIVMIGDAAHPIATNAHNGSVGAGLAIADGAVIATLLAKYFGPPTSSTNTGNVSLEMTSADTEAGLRSNEVDRTEDEITHFEKLSKDFDAERLQLSNQVMREARYEGGWDRVENTWFRSLLRLSYKYTPTTWVKAGYATRLTRGGVRLPDLRLSPFHPSQDIPL